MKRKFAKRRAFEIGLFVLAGVSLAAMVLACEDPRFRETVWAVAPVLRFTSTYPDAWNKFIYDLGLASFVSLLFYWLIVRLPEYRKRTRIKRSFKAQYGAFKTECIEVLLLLADGSYDGAVPETLTDQKAFRDYFKTWVGDGQNRWHRVMNTMDEHHLQILLNRMTSFREEILFVLNNVDTEAEGAFEFAKTLSKAIASASVTTPGYDRRPLIGFLWYILSGWDPVAGYPERDVIEDLIREL